MNGDPQDSCKEVSKENGNENCDKTNSTDPAPSLRENLVNDEGTAGGSDKSELNALLPVEPQQELEDCGKEDSSDESSVNSNNYGNEVSSADFKEDDEGGDRKKRRGKKGRERRVRHDESKLIKERNEKSNNGNAFDSDNTGNNSSSQSTKERNNVSDATSEITVPSLKTTWRNDNKTLQCKLKFILFHEAKPFCDIVFIVGAQKEEIHAHKLILSLSSQVFEELILKNDKDDSKILIPDVEPLVFKEILQFIYTDDFESSKTDDIEFSLSLMAAAKMFKVPELNVCIGRLMKSKLTAKNVIRIFERGEGPVMGDAQQFIMTNAKTVFCTDEFLTLSHPKLCKLLINNNLMLDELTVFDRTLSWAKEECKRMGLDENAENLRGVLHSAIYLIRFPLLTAQEFTFRVLPHGILSESEQLEIFKYFSVRETPIQESLQLQLKFSCIKRSPIPSKKPPIQSAQQQVAAKPPQSNKQSVLSLPTSKPLSSPLLSNPFPSTSSLNTSAPKKISQSPSPITTTPTTIKLSVAEKQIRSDITKDAEEILENLSNENINDSIQSFKKLQLCNNEGRVDCFVRVLFRKLAERSNICDVFAKFMLLVVQCNHQPTTRLKKQFLEHSQRVFERKTVYDGIVQKLKLKIDTAQNQSEKLDLLSKYEIKNTNLRYYYLSNIQFMAELFKVQLLTPSIIVNSVNVLLQTPDDDSLESICHLLKTCGEKLDFRLQQHTKLTQAMSDTDFPCAPNWLDNVFGQLSNIFNNDKHIRFEIRLMLIELIEIRQNGWALLNAKSSANTNSH